MNYLLIVSILVIIVINVMGYVAWMRSRTETFPYDYSYSIPNQDFDVQVGSTEQIPSDKLIGLMYPPKLGPLHMSNRVKFPHRNNDGQPFVALYSGPPFVVYHNDPKPVLIPSYID